MITMDEYNYMIEQPGSEHIGEDGKSRITYNSGDKYFTMWNEAGHHSLYAPVTDLARLNAHWAGFTRN